MRKIFIKKIICIIFLTFIFSVSGSATQKCDLKKDNNTNYSAFIGLNFEHLKMGVSNGTNTSKPDFRLNYKKAF